jgi:hypothetical protein
MSVYQMCVEDRLAGASNWSPWKARIVFVLEDLKLWDIVEAFFLIIPVTTQEEEQQGKEDHFLCSVGSYHSPLDWEDLHMRCGHLYAICMRSLMRTGCWFFMID